MSMAKLPEAHLCERIDPSIAKLVVWQLEPYAKFRDLELQKPKRNRAGKASNRDKGRPPGTVQIPS